MSDSEWDRSGEPHEYELGGDTGGAGQRSLPDGFVSWRTWGRSVTILAMKFCVIYSV